MYLLSLLNAQHRQGGLPRRNTDRSKIPLLSAVWFLPPLCVTRLPRYRLRVRKQAFAFVKFN